MNFLSKLAGGDGEQGGGGAGGWLASLQEKARELGEVYKRDIGEFAATVKKDTAEVLEHHHLHVDAEDSKPSPVAKSTSGHLPARSTPARVTPTRAKPAPGRSPKLIALQASRITYTQDPEDEAAFAKFSEGFDAKQRTSQIAELLKASPAMEKLHGDLVPEKVSYTLFWCRYFFRAEALQAEEKKKELLLSASDNIFGAEEEFEWDDEDDSSKTPVAAKSASQPAPKPAPQPAPTPAAPAPAAPAPEAAAHAPAEKEAGSVKSEAVEGGGDASALKAASQPEQPKEEELPVPSAAPEPAKQDPAVSLGAGAAAAERVAAAAGSSKADAPATAKAVEKASEDIAAGGVKPDAQPGAGHSAAVGEAGDAKYEEDTKGRASAETSQSASLVNSATIFSATESNEGNSDGSNASSGFTPVSKEVSAQPSPQAQAPAKAQEEKSKAEDKRSTEKTAADDDWDDWE